METGQVDDLISTRVNIRLTSTPSAPTVTLSVDYLKIGATSRSITMFFMQAMNLLTNRSLQTDRSSFRLFFGRMSGRCEKKAGSRPQMCLFVGHCWGTK